MSTTVSADTLATLKTIATSTITTLLYKRGFRNVFIQGARPLKPGQRLAGPAFTIADLNVASVLMVAPMAGLDLGAAPNAAAWLARATARPALAKAQSRH